MSKSNKPNFGHPVRQKWDMPHADKRQKRESRHQVLKEQDELFLDEGDLEPMFPDKTDSNEDNVDNPNEENVEIDWDNDLERIEEFLGATMCPYCHGPAEDYNNCSEENR